MKGLGLGVEVVMRLGLEEEDDWLGLVILVIVA